MLIFDIYLPKLNYFYHSLVLSIGQGGQPLMNFFYYYYYYCSAASDYRKRRKSEPSSSRVNAPSQNRAATSPKQVDALRPTSSLKKPVTRSSPSSPSRAKGIHFCTNTSFISFFRSRNQIMRRPPLKCKEVVLYPPLFLFYLLSPSYRVNCALPGNLLYCKFSTVCNVCLV